MGNKLTPEQVKQLAAQTAQQNEPASLVGVKINFQTDEECYVRFEEFRRRSQQAPPFTLGVLFTLTAVSAVEFYVTRAAEILLAFVLVLLLFLIAGLARRQKNPLRAVQKYRTRDDYYTCNKQMVFDRDCLSVRAFDSSAAVIYEAVYPYAMADAIYVTPKDYYFFLGNQLLIFPREYATQFNDDVEILEVFKSSGKLRRID